MHARMKMNSNDISISFLLSPPINRVFFELTFRQEQFPLGLKLRIYLGRCRIKIPKLVWVMVPKVWPFRFVSGPINTLPYLRR